MDDEIIIYDYPDTRDANLYPRENVNIFIEGYKYRFGQRNLSKQFYKNVVKIGIIELFKKRPILYFNGGTYSLAYNESLRNSFLNDWSNIQTIELKTRQIKVGELSEIITSHGLKRKSKVKTVYHNNEAVAFTIEEKNIYGFGEQNAPFIFDSDGRVVTSISLIDPVLNYKNLEYRSSVSEILNILAVKWNLILLDWETCRIFDIKDKEIIKYYFSNLYRYEE